MKNVLLGSMTVVVSLLAALVVAELIVRLTWTPPSTLSTQVTKHHPVYRWAPRPGITGRQVSMEFDHGFSHTAQGLRGNDLYSGARPGSIRHRVLFLGDSFTYGNGNEDHEIFVQRVNTAMPHTEVINTGANGYGQRQQLAILDTLGAAVAPDLVVVMFFWNDAEDNLKLPSPDFRIGDDGSVVRTDLAVPPEFDPLAHRVDINHTDADQRPLRRTYLYKLFKEGGRGIRHRLFGSRQRTIQNAEQHRAAWAVTTKLLRLIHLRSTEIGAKLIVVAIPDYQFVDPENGAMTGQKPLNIDIEEPLRAACATLGIMCLDLLPGLKLKQAAETKPFYYTIDRHFTPQGNAAVAEILTPVLRDLLRD